MPQPMNPDGTVQVAPPTVSAFAPQPTQTPPPMQQTPMAGAGQQATPGISGAIMDAIKALAQAFAPKSITQRKAAVNGQVDNTESLGDKF
jgi:hypothetical protein